MRIQKLDESTKKNLLEDLLKRSPNQYSEFEERVATILSNVKKDGDAAVLRSAYRQSPTGAVPRRRQWQPSWTD